jgi:hypothetical protein
MNSLVLVLFFILSATSAFAAPPQVPKGGYPDVWYRLYDWPTHPCDAFFSDEKIWGNEPVLILCNDEKRDVVAEGFFSRKRYPVTKTVVPIPNDGKGGRVNYRYKYKHSGRLMTIRGLFSKDARRFASGVELPDGAKIKTEEGRLWFFMPYVACEPILYSVKYVGKDGVQQIWSKSVVRYFPQGEQAPLIDNKNCPGTARYWLSQGANPSLLLPDNTVLVTDEREGAFVVRMRLADGESKILPANLKIIDTKNVTKAKQSLFRQSDEGKKTKNRDDITEDVYRGLAKYFFTEFFTDNQ